MGSSEQEYRPWEDGAEMGKRIPTCPRCGANVYYKDGSAGNGKQRYRCKVCGKCYVGRDPVRPVIREIATGLIREGIPVKIIAKAMGRNCSVRWLYTLKTTLLNG